MILHMLKSHSILPLFLLCCSYCSPAMAADIHLRVADMSGGGFSASGIDVHFAAQGGELVIGRLRLAGQTWDGLHLGCRELRIESDAIACIGGSLGDKTSGIPLTVVYRASSARLELEMGEHTHSTMTVVSRAGQWTATGRLRGFQLRWLAGLLPQGMPQPGNGTLEGEFSLTGDGRGISALSTHLTVSQAAFTDGEGLHAGEGVGGDIECRATRRGRGMDWRVGVGWRTGEVFWQPFYLQSGYRLEAVGRLTDGGAGDGLVSMRHPDIGEMQARLDWRPGSQAVSLHGERLQLARLFNDWGKPMLAQTSLSQARLSGEAGIDWQYEGGRTRALSLRFERVEMQDGQGRFALHGLHGDIPWAGDAPAVASLGVQGGELLGIPLGPTEASMAMQGMAFSAAELGIPVWDGKLTLRDVHVHQEDGRWHASLSGNLTPVSMPAMSRAFGWPEMSGSLSGMIPQVTYGDGRIGMEGALLFQVFDGTVVASHLSLEDAFGLAPRFSGDLDMRELDLGMLTHTFSFGSMQGKLDVGVHGLSLQNWQPVSFDARVSSSPGSYPRKISQRAVENITALGGGGATVAMQRWYLQMFKSFGYDRIGLSCVLRDGVCQMDGVEPVGGGYAIIKGGGIPAINVIGYNRNVGWQELLSRLKRVLDNNARPVIE